MPAVRRFSNDAPQQVLYPAEKEDIDILVESDVKYPRPIEVEGGVIIRLVRLSDPVTSPVARTVRNRQFGIRDNEKYKLLGWGILAAAGLSSLGFWQLRRMKWKAGIIEMRRERLAMPREVVTHGNPLPWAEKPDEWAYRTVELHGVLDVNREMLVGPRPGFVPGSPGFVAVVPLRLEDGSTVLVNRGHFPMEFKDRDTRMEVPEWVTVRGVLDPGEILHSETNAIIELKNNPSTKSYIRLIPGDFAVNSGSRNVEETGLFICNAYDILFDDDKGVPKNMRRIRPGKYDLRRKEEYLCFWADEHTHFNYAMQWFAMAASIIVMCVYKFVEVSRWKF